MLQKQIAKIAKNIGVYEIIKRSIVDNSTIPVNVSEIEFYSHITVKLYDIDQLLENYSTDNQDVRAELEKALTKLNKSEVVKDVNRSILHTIDQGKMRLQKRRYLQKLKIR